MKTKMRKFGAWLMAMALAFAGADAVQAAEVHVSDAAGLKNAFANATAGTTIVLDADITTKDHLSCSKDCVLDLAGHKIVGDYSSEGTFGSGTLINVTGSTSFKLISSASGGGMSVDGVKSFTGKYNGVAVNLSSTATATFGEADGSNADFTLYGAYQGMNVSGTVIFNGGSFECGADGVAVQLQSGCNVVLNGGSISSFKGLDSANISIGVGKALACLTSGGLMQLCDIPAEGLDLSYGQIIIGVANGKTYKVKQSSAAENKNQLKICAAENTTATVVLDGLCCNNSDTIVCDSGAGSAIVLELDNASTLTGGIRNVGEGELVIQDENGTAGSIKITASNYCAAIGGNQVLSPVGKNITIKSGTIECEAGYGAAIGGGGSSGGNAVNIRILGGTVTAKSERGAAIGGGTDGHAENVIISGGKVVASSDRGKAVGDGFQSSGSTGISISCGTYSPAPTADMIVAGYEVIEKDGKFMIGVTEDDVVITTDTQETKVEVPAEVVEDEEVAKKIAQGTKVEGVKLTATDTEQKKGGVQTVVEEAKKDPTFAAAVAAAAEVSVKVEVEAKPTEFDKTEDKGKVEFVLTPKATVTVVQNEETLTKTVPVSNDMIDQSQKFAVSIYTGFRPATILHNDNEGNLIEMFGSGDIVYDEVSGVATVMIAHFSKLLATEEENDPYVKQGYTKVADGFYQSAPTYTASDDFYITSKAGLEYFRDLVNGKDVLDAYIASDCGKSLNRSVMRFSGKTVKLLADINLNNEIWEPISVNSDKDVFCGTFDGGNHVISNLKVVYEGSTSKAGAGLFGYIKNAVTIQNVTIDNADISGFDCVGGVVGISSSPDTVIRNCKLTGSVSITSRSSFVGGIIGHTYAKEISGCSVEATGGTGIYCGGTGIRVGGICGYNQYTGAVLEDCHVENIDIAMAHRYLIGGIVGTVVSGAKVIRCDVEDVNISCNFEPNYGLIVGLVDGSSNLSIVEDCSAVNSTATGKTTEGNDTTKIANTELVGRTGAAGSVGSPSANLVVGSDIEYDGNGKIKGGKFDVLPESAIAEGFVPAVDPDTGKTVVEEDPIEGSGTAADPYVISDLKGLKLFRDRVNAGNTYLGKFVKLGADIDLASVANWEPIGTSAHPFMGSFDGDNKTISNLKINATTQYQGLFGYVKAISAEGPYPTLKNLTLENVDVKTTAGYAGGFAGKVWCCTVENITVKGSVNAGKVYNHSWVGGVMGHSYGTARNCRFEGSVVGYGSVGGISGASGDTKFYDCAVNGDISGNYWVGGIAGNGQEGTSCTRCTVKGTISADRNYYGGTGGIAGAAGMYSSCTFEDNYFDGVVKIGDTEIGNPVIGAVNAGAEVAATVKIEGNSWNTEKIPNDVTVAVIGMDMEGLADNTTEEQARAVAQRTEDRNANLVGSVKDLAYVGSGVVEIAAGSAIADKSLEQIQAAIESDDPTKTVEIVEGKVVVTENIAKIGNAMFPTLAKAFEAAAGMTGSADAPIIIELFPGTIEEGTVKLPSVLKNVKMVGAADKATTIKNTRIMASDGGAWDYENLTFEGAVYDNSQFVITGCRASEVCTAKNFAFIGNEFKDIVNAVNNAAIHFVVGESEPVNGLRVENNVIDGLTGSQISGIYVTCLTGDFIVRNNTIANCSHREMNIGIITADGIDDNVVITDNLTYGNYAEMQIYGEGATSTDNVSWNVSYNILDNESTVADSMCLYKTNPEKTTFVLDHNYYRKNPDTNPGSFYLNGARTAADIENYGVYPYYASYDKEALAAGASVREALKDLTGAVAAVVSVDGNDTNEFSRLSSALTAAGEGEKVILLANTAEENVPLKPKQEIVLNGHAFTGTVTSTLDPEVYDAMVTTPDGKVFSAPAKVEVPIGESSVIKVRMLDTAENLSAVKQNGRPLWANKALGIANDCVIKPVVERPAVGSKTISIKSNIPDSVLEAAAQQRDGVSVKFQLAKKVGSVGTYVQFGEKQPKPEFTVEADEQEVQTFWKIQIFFEEEY